MQDLLEIKGGLSPPVRAGFPRKRDTRCWGAVKALDFPKTSFEQGKITRGRAKVDQCAADKSVLGVDEIDQCERVVFRV